MAAYCCARDVQGLKASLLGAIPYSAVRLGSYDGLKWAYKRVRTHACCPILPAILIHPSIDQQGPDRAKQFLQ